MELPSLNWTPRSDWVNVRQFGALGDGQNDDTGAIQKAFDQVRSGTSVYFPRGTYRITRTLTITGPALGIAVIGHGNETTLFWDGEAGGKLFMDNGISNSRYIGITFDGRSKAAIGFYHFSTKRFETEVLHRFLAFRNFTDAGIRAGKKDRYALAETTFDHCIFEKCGRGAAFTSFNDYNWTFDGCEFSSCDIGIECRHGNFYVRNSHFQGSRTVDILAQPEHACSLRRCTSVGSNQFLDFANPVAAFTVQDCHIASWRALSGAIKINGAPVTMFDRSFSNGPDNAAAIQTSRAGQRLILSGNTIDTGKLLEAPSRKFVYSVPAGKRTGSLRSATQRFYLRQASVPGKVFDARKFGAKGDGRSDDTAAIQRTIDAAREHGKNAIAYLPAGRYIIRRTLIITGKDYTVGGSGFLTKVAWRGPKDGTMVMVRNPQRLTLEHIAIGNHDSGQMNNAIDILQEGGKGPSSIVYDGVYVYGMYQRQPLRKGIIFRRLGPQETVILSGVQGNLRFIDCARATVLARTSFEGTVTIEGKDPRRDGFIGFLTRLATITTHGLYLKDNQSVVMSDFYVEQANNGFVFEGSPDLPPGRATIQLSKLHFTVPKEGPDLGTALTINNYKGRIFLGHSQYYVEPPKVRIRHKGNIPTELFLYGRVFYRTRPDIQGTDALTVRFLGNAAVGYVTADGVAETLDVARDVQPQQAAKALAQAFDELRRLGQLELRLIYPQVLSKPR